MVQNPLPLVDITAFLDGSDKPGVAKAFAAAMEGTGFAVITGHGVPKGLADALYATMTAYFDHDLDVKSSHTPPEKAKARGYLPMGVESVGKTLGGETPHDLCEALVFAAPHRPEKDRNIWPETPAELSGLVQDWTREIVRLTHDLTRLKSLALDLPETYFDSAHADPALTLRFVNYPDQETPPAPGQLRYGEHHDYGGLTILRQDGAPGGLEVMGKDGAWHEAEVVPDSFVINVGDLLARWTNDRWKSTLHRVTNPPRDLTGSTRRLSMVAFTGPREDVEVACLPSCQSADSPAKYEPVQAGDYIMSKIRASHDLTPTD
ncbi:MAG: 2OG-Fe(II) oxygenase family protein [Pseudomonadota bacterium]